MCLWHCVAYLLYVGDKTPDIRIMWWFNISPHRPAPPSLGYACPPLLPPCTSHLPIWRDVFFRTGSDLCRLCQSVCAHMHACVLSASRSAPLTEDISKSVSQPISKEVIAFSVALFFVCVCVFPTFILKMYLSLEKLMNLQRSVCTVLIMEYLWFLLQHALSLKKNC